MWLRRLSCRRPVGVPERVVTALKLWVPPDACPHRGGDLFFQVRSEWQAIFQCRLCGSVWNHNTVPESVAERVNEILKTGEFAPMAQLLGLLASS
jgi:hypothetical protein